MKGRILFALLFAALMALGISSLNDLQAQKAALPPPERVVLHLAVLPPAEPENASVSAEKALPVIESFHMTAQQEQPRTQSVPPLLQSYYLAWYQAFHYSDRAG